MSTAHTVQLHYTKAIVSRGVREVWSRQVGYLWPAVTVAIGAAAFFLAMYRHRTDWIVGVMATCALLSAWVILAMYRVQRRRSMHALVQLDGQPARMDMTDTHVALISPAGEARMPWTQFKALWRLQTVWALEQREGGVSMLPKADLDEESRALLLQHLQRAGAKLC